MRWRASGVWWGFTPGLSVTPEATPIAIVIAADVRGNAEIGDPLEISEIHAFTKDTLPFGYMSYGTETMLRDYLENRTVVA